MSQADPKSESQPVLKLGSYRLIEPLGSGGMSSVFRAIHEEQGLEVAVKVLPRYLAKNPVLLQRFLREAQSAESLEHPGIVSIYDRGVADGRYYLVLEYVPGSDLHDTIRQNGPMALAEAVDVAIQAAEALRYASSKGLIHRDIKPANLLRDPSGHVKLIDLGLALQNETEDERVTRDGTTVGTVDYMAPEQARDSRAATHQSDIYSLGCTLFFLLTGRPPFAGGDIADKLRRHAQVAPPDLQALRPDVPNRLARIVSRMLAKNPADRYPDYDSLIADLRAIPALELVDNSETFDALIDDEEEEKSGEVAEALIDEEGDESADFQLGQPSNRQSVGDAPSTAAALARSRELEAERSGLVGREAPPNSWRGEPARAPSPFQMADLADLAEEEDATPPVQPPRFTLPGTARGGQLGNPDAASLRTAEPLEQDEDETIEAEIDDETEEEFEEEGWPGNWVVMGALGSMLVVLLILCVIVLVRRDLKAREEGSLSGSGPAEEVGKGGAVEALREEQPPPILAEPRPEEIEPANSDRPGSVGKTPTTSVATVPVELEVSEEVDREFRSAGTLREALEPGLKVVRVRRIGAEGLRRALEQSDVAIELDDLGPFFESDLRIRGSRRVIRAPEGKRAIVVLRSATFLEKEPAPITLERSRLMLERIDLVVPGQVLSPDQKFVFSCGRQSQLTLRDCTVTIVPRGSKEIGLAKVTAGTDSEQAEVELTRTFVRGASGPIFQVDQGASRFEIERSVLATTGEGAFLFQGVLGPSELLMRRAFVGSSGPGFVLRGGSGQGGRPEEVNIRALASCMIRVVGSRPSVPLLEVGGGSVQVAWKGYGNQFLGWSRIAEDSSGQPLEGAGGSAPAFWEEAGPSRFEVEPPRIELPLSALTAEDLQRRVTGFEATLLTIPGPSPGLMDRAIGPFAPFLDEPPVAPSSEPATRFDMADPRFRGDVGALVKLLAGSFTRPTGWIRIEVTGSPPAGGVQRMTPIRLKPGLSLEVRVSPALQGKVAWRPRPEFLGDGLIVLQGGDLRLTGVRLELPEDSGVKGGLLIESGRVALDRCQIGSSREALEGEPALITARAPKAERGAAAAFGREWLRIQNTLLLGRGGGLRARSAGGIVALRNSAIATVGPAIEVMADESAEWVGNRGLLLDRCTVASEAAMVSVPWKGETEAGASRSLLLVRSRNTHFLDDYSRRLRTTPVLLVDPELLAAGGVAWEGEKDGFEVGRFVAMRGEPMPEGKPTDYRQDWLGLWGPAHVSVQFGPIRSGGEPGPPRKVGRLRSGAPDRASLFPDGWTPDRVSGVGADPSAFLPEP